MLGGQKTCDDCGETYHGGTDLSKYGCRCLKAKYNAAKASRAAFNDVQPEAPTDSMDIGGRVQCPDCWEFYNKGTNLRLYGCACKKAQLEAVFAEPKQEPEAKGEGVIAQAEGAIAHAAGVTYHTAAGVTLTAGERLSSAAHTVQEDLAAAVHAVQDTVASVGEKISGAVHTAYSKAAGATLTEQEPGFSRSIDAASSMSFPASDPPSFNQAPGMHHTTTGEKFAQAVHTLTDKVADKVIQAAAYVKEAAFHGAYCHNLRCYHPAVAGRHYCQAHDSHESKEGGPKGNPFERCKSELKVGEETFQFYNIKSLNDKRVAKLPYSIKVLLECAVRNADGFEITEGDIENILNWEKTSRKDIEIPFKPARVLLQDFTGVPSVVDLAAMREAMKRLGGDPDKINPLVPAELVIDHSVQVDFARTPEAIKKNLDMEMHRNHERFQFLKWGQKAFQNFRVVPPGSGIVHQVNLEYLARVVFNNNGMLYPDSVVGTDSHTTMINGLGVTGWGVGGIEAEAVMMGTAISMLLPEVIGYRLTGKMPTGVTATDLVLTVTANLRKKDVVGKFVEFFGPGLDELTLADRATIANMAPEYGATQGFFPIDRRTLEYMRTTNRSKQVCDFTEAYLRAQGMFIDHEQKTEDPVYSDVMELDLSTLVPCVSGPKRPHDRVAVADLKTEWNKGLTGEVNFKGYGIDKEKANDEVEFTYEGETHKLRHGSVVIAAITSCTNTSNPSVLVGAGLLAKAAVERGLTTKNYIKTSLAPGSGVVTEYLTKAGLLPYLEKIGFGVVGYGCTTCIGNSGELAPEVEKAVTAKDLVVAAVLSGNRNFEGRVHPQTRANYLASPPLVVAYALAGTVNFDFEKEPLGKDQEGKDVFLKDLWPSNEAIDKVVSESVKASMFEEVYKSIEQGTPAWNELKVEASKMFPWDEKSTYIHHPPFFQNMGVDPDAVSNIDQAYCLLNLGDSITTDHISPAGNISKSSAAAKYLKERGVAEEDFNTYGARRGHDEIMARGTFANTRLMNKLVPKPGPNTLHVPSGQVLSVYDVAAKYQEEHVPSIILGGAMYGSGSSRDWAAKGPFMQGVKAVIAKSFERIHRSNLVGMGILPLQFKDGEDADSLGLTGKERFSIDLTSPPLKVGAMVTVRTDNNKTFETRSRVDTAVELSYLKHGGILQAVIRKLLKK